MGTTFWTFTFRVNPQINNGYTEAFNQGGEPWWWLDKGPYEGPAAGNVDLTGATLIAIHSDGDKVWEPPSESQ